jgi:hypothetical protein
MLPRSTKILLWLGAIIVVALLLLNLYMGFKPLPKAHIDRPLVQLLPAAPAGWQSHDADIADTPEDIERVESVLHYDDAVYRVYGNGRATIGVYIAHWLPGKFSPAKVGSHSPDTCWVHNGWDRINYDKEVKQPLAGGMLKPMEYGEYEKSGEHVHVIFWHLVGGQSVTYDLNDWDNGLAGRIQRLPAMVSDFSQFGLDQRQEQLVVRVSSNLPFTQLWDDPSFKVLMEGLSQAFDLYATPPPDASATPGIKTLGAVSKL